MNIFYKLLLLFILLTSISNSQNLKRLGIKSGLVISKQNWEYSDIDIDRYDKHYYGLYLGISYDIISSKFLSTNFEVAYIQKGAAEEIHTTVFDPYEQVYVETGKKTFRNRFDNISMTIFGNIKYDTEFITPYFLFGPRVDIQVNREIELDKLSNKFKKYIYGYSFGIGVLFRYFDEYDIIFELVSSPNIRNLYKTQFVKISNHSYEIKFGIKL